MTDALTGVVLAGGESTRYGAHNKLLERVDGRPMVERVGSVLEAVTSAPPVMVVRSPEQRAVLEDALAPGVPVRFRYDRAGFEGPLAGIAGALAGVDTEWMVVCAGDMPNVSARAFEELVARVDCETDVVVPVRDGRLEPLHTVYRRNAVADAIDELSPTSGVWSLVSVLSATAVPVEEDALLARSLGNVNTPEDFNRLTAERPTEDTSRDRRRTNE